MSFLILISNISSPRLDWTIQILRKFRLWEKNGHIKTLNPSFIPLHKQALKDRVDNYRDMNLLNCFNEIFEKIIHKQLISFLNKHMLTFQYQYGFWESYSTTLALIEIIADIKSKLDNGEYVIGAYLDLKKAFDTVNHNILCDKFDHYGIREHSLEYFKSYWTNTYCNNVSSSSREITYGMPQGSVLGPLLFLIYMNDTVNCVEGANVRLFADDMAIFIHGKDLHKIYTDMQSPVCKVKDWFVSNRLTLNLSKMSYSIYHTLRRKIPGMYDNLKIGGEHIFRVKDLERSYWSCYQISIKILWNIQ